MNDFTSPEEFYSTLFHELVHSTGHESRLKRQFGKSFGDEQYSKEELIAEIGAAMLCSMAGIEQVTIENSAAYIGGWLKALRNDKRMIVTASTAAQKAADYILNNTGMQDQEENNEMDIAS
jgi:antirestriction protein ArdC